MNRKARIPLKVTHGEVNGHTKAMFSDYGEGYRVGTLALGETLGKGILGVLEHIGGIILTEAP